MKLYIIALICTSIIIVASNTLFAKNKNESKSSISVSKSIHQFKITDINGKPYDLKNTSGNIILLVNTASKCGFTYQYEQLEALYQKYKNKNFMVIGIPSNNFGNQEPGSNESIKDFCTLNFDVTFPMMSKMNVKGKNITDLYKFITDKKIHPKTGGKISWNFNKFLINQSGEIVKRYSSLKKPLSKDIQSDINKLIENNQIN